MLSEMCSERDSPLKRLYLRTHAKLTRLAGSVQLVWAAGCELSLALASSAACVTGRDIRDNTSGGPAAQNPAARSHTSELTRGCFCFRVSTGGPRWAPQVSRASSGWPGAGKTKGSRGLSLSLHISDAIHCFGLDQILRWACYSRATRKVLTWSSHGSI